MQKPNIRPWIKDIPNFPSPGILFRDFSPLLANPKIFRETIDWFCTEIKKKSPTKLVAIESRGFVLASAISYQLDIGIVLARKPGKLPGEKFSEAYDLEYGSTSLEIQTSLLNAEDRVAIVDDVLATGGTIEAVVKLCRRMNASIVSSYVLIELEALKGRQRLELSPVESLLVL